MLNVNFYSGYNTLIIVKGWTCPIKMYLPFFRLKFKEQTCCELKFVFIHFTGRFYSSI
jgi:hypothetical protein